jgi:hypothetical protein
LYWKQSDCSTFQDNKIVGQSLKAKGGQLEMITQATFHIEPIAAIFPPGFNPVLTAYWFPQSYESVVADRWVSNAPLLKSGLSV